MSAFVTRASILAALLCGACDINFFVCEIADDQALAALPTTLAETGIDDPDVITVVPRFPLWSDGASKRRWLALPPGTRIDSSDPDSWRFPVGTSSWKEFARDGVRVETRLLRKIGPAARDWIGVSYVWNDDQTRAEAEPLGRLGALGTPHNVPAAGECSGCHGGRRSWLLGISTVQLGYDDGDPETLELSDLQAQGLLTHELVNPRLELPGNDTESAALGYLHANCAHCHNSERPQRDSTRCFDPKNELDFWLRLDALGSVEETPTYRTVVESDVIVRGDPGASDLFDRVNRRGFIYQMPPLGSEEIDRDAVAVLRQWIAAL